MKHIFFLLALFGGLLTSCKNSNSVSDEDNDEAKSPGQKKISKRDYSITPANAYSTLFLDSSAVENFITEKKLSDSVARRIRSFYNTRNYQFAWFSSDGLTEQALGFWNLHDYVTTYNNDTTLKDKALQKRMDNLVTTEDLSVSADNKTYVNTELTLTQHFILYMLNNYEKGYVKRKEMERFVPFKKEDALQLADSILNKKHKDNKYFEDINENYKKLKDQLGRYYAIAKNGGWPELPEGTKLKKGSSDSLVVLLKRRLSLEGDLPARDTSRIFNDTLEMGIRNYQERLGYTPDGKLSATLVKELNVPVQERLTQILMNMGRMRWMPEPAQDGQLIVVNIPEFKLHVYEGKNQAFEMNVVVGKEGHNTMMFNGDLNQIVFSPYWNVPPSIVKNEILPKLAANPGYLESQNMEQTGTEGGLPAIRQRPGGNNSLGKVKFLFPNSFNIYFHDTPAKSLFAKDKRAYSHGCIRLEEPEKMAQYLLRNEPEWTTDRIDAAMNAGQEKYVKLKKPVPVIITYYTAWVDNNGRVNFREDVYDHDQKLARKMFKGGL